MKTSCKIKFIDSCRLMPSSLSSLVDNLSEAVHSEKCTGCKSCLDYMITKDDQLIFRCLECKKNYKKDFNNELMEVCNGDINKFILLLRKGVYRYESMDSWDKFDETSLTDKEAFIANYIWKALQMLTIGMQIMYLKNLNYKM